MGLLDAGRELSNAPGPRSGLGACSRELEPSCAICSGGFRTSGWDREPDGGALVVEGGRELHRIWTVDRKPAGSRVDLEFPAWLLAFQEGGPKTDAPGGIAGA